MHVVAVPDRVVRTRVRLQQLGVETATSGKRLVLLQRVGDVDPEPVDAAVQPEPQGALEVVDDLGVLPVEVGLLGGEQVEVPLAVGQPGPGRAAEDRLPVGRGSVRRAHGRAGTRSGRAGSRSRPKSRRAAARRAIQQFGP